MSFIIAGTGVNIGGPDTLAKREELRYSNKKESDLYDLYLQQVKTGWLTPLATFDNYKKQYQAIEDKVIGLTTSDGVQIKSQSKHFIARVIGTKEDPKTKRARSGVPVDDVVDALKNPLKIIGDKSDEKKRPSVKYIGRNGTVSVNPTDGNLIQCNPTEEKVRKSLEERMLKK